MPDLNVSVVLGEYAYDLMNKLIVQHQDRKHSFLEEYRHSDVEVLDNDMRGIEQSQNKVVNHLRAKYDPEFLKTIPQLRREIRNYLFTELKSSPDREEEYQLILSKLILLMLKNDSKASIITTNYDMLVENACTLADTVVSDGFQKKEASMSAIWGDYWPDNHSVELVKLHGSINWHAVADKIIKESIPSTHEPQEDILISPTLEPKTYDNQPFDDLWKRFRHILGGTSLLVVIGFSFRDEKLVDMIKEFIKYGLTVLSVSPNATNDVKGKFEHWVTLTHTDEAILPSENDYFPVYTFESRFGSNEMPSIMLALDYVTNAIQIHDSTVPHTEI